MLFNSQLLGSARQHSGSRRVQLISSGLSHICVGWWLSDLLCLHTEWSPSVWPYPADSLDSSTGWRQVFKCRKREQAKFFSSLFAMFVNDSQNTEAMQPSTTVECCGKLLSFSLHLKQTNTPPKPSS